MLCVKATLIQVGGTHTRPRWLAAILGVLICKCNGISNETEKGYLKPLRDVKNVVVDKLSTQREKVCQNVRKCP